ncbi:hypothetical protein CBR_g3020 [Chara braunii]|uniref:Reverse transcriptase RNase H-like domain-containing protein n=1 Tax=Chara braunii TaxID=69332 RepID=A0A388KEI6_CHABU|nr:hypothetical protein CBR_g3020 [Chara braunii]|eukprot:GBG68475.1 hypothetical protein CBR_g3020 [Chara braunii]
MDGYPMYDLLVGFSLWGTLWGLLFPLGFWNTMTCRVETRGGTGTTPYTKEQEEEAAKILAKQKARKEKREVVKQAKKLALQELERLKREEEAKLKAVEEEEEEEEKVGRGRSLNKEAFDKLQAIHSRQRKSVRALKGVMDELVVVPEHGVTETQLVNLFYCAMPEPLRRHFFEKSKEQAMTYDTLSREVVVFEAQSMPVSTFWHKDLDKGKKWKGHTISGQVKAKDHLILTLDEGGMEEVPYNQKEWGLEEEDNSEHEGQLRQVLEKLREANFKINAKKCEWAKTQVLYLGHVLDGDGIKPEDSKIAAIRDWPTPRTLTKLRSFLGLANYYRKFVRNFSTIVAPLRRLLKKEAIWGWDRDCTPALKKSKRALIEYPVLKVADPSLPFVITTNVSRYGIGAVLQQDDGNGYRPVEFMSARMPSEKVATSTYERELYALRQALDHWKHYLLGRHFKVYSDHETLRWLKMQAKMTPKLTRWAAETDQFDFELKPVKGE